MLLCSNNPFRFLAITALATCLPTAWLNFLYAEDGQAKKVLVLHSYHHALPRIYFANKNSPKKIVLYYSDNPFLRRVELRHKQEEKWLNRKIIRFNII